MKHLRQTNNDANINLKMDQFTKDKFDSICFMESANLLIKMIRVMMEIGSEIKEMVLDYKFIKMVIFMKANGIMI
jgi:hypothetical protein